MTREDSSTSSYDTWYSNNYNTAINQVSSLGKQHLIDVSSNYNLANESSKLVDYASNTFTVGNKRAFQIISDELCDKLQEVDKEVNKYLELAEEKRAKIQACMEQDARAREAAKQAYKDFMANKKPYESEYYDDVLCVTVYQYDSLSHKADAAAKREEVWLAERCDLW